MGGLPDAPGRMRHANATQSPVAPHPNETSPQPITVGAADPNDIDDEEDDDPSSSAIPSSPASPVARGRSRIKTFDFVKTKRLEQSETVSVLKAVPRAGTVWKLDAGQEETELAALQEEEGS